MKNAKIGAVVGFSLSFVYSIFIIILQSLHMNNLLSIWIEILFMLLIISFSSAIIGSITSIVFGWILKKLNKSMTVFTITCLTISFLAVFPINLAYFNWALQISSGDGHSISARNDLFWVIFPPSILYIIASGIVSRYLYKNNASS